MLQVIVYSLPLALIVWFSPTRIMAATLMLFSSRARSVAGGYAVGWVVGTTICVVAFTLGATLASAMLSSTGSSNGDALLDLLVGLAMLVLSGVAWRARPRTGVERPPERLNRMIDRLTPLSALGLGVAVSIVSPTHLLAIASFGAAIAGSGISVADQIAVAVVFIVLCTSSITIPVGVAIVAPERSDAPLRRLHSWLSEHGQTVLVVLFLVIGVIFLGKAIAAVG
jgi:hypothetical protein